MRVCRVGWWLKRWEKRQVDADVDRFEIRIPVFNLSVCFPEVEVEMDVEREHVRRGAHIHTPLFILSTAQLLTGVRSFRGVLGLNYF